MYAGYLLSAIEACSVAVGHIACSVFFFFQAEDGIRDLTVTGVQTCALPIYEVRLPYRDIAKPGVEFRQETVLSIDPDRKRVVTNGGAYDADVLVVALGADLDPAATPGLIEGGYEFYTPEGAERAREILPKFDVGVA